MTMPPMSTTVPDLPRCLPSVHDACSNDTADELDTPDACGGAETDRYLRGCQQFRNDDLVNVGLGQLSEARKQTLLLDENACHAHRAHAYPASGIRSAFGGQARWLRVRSQPKRRRRHKWQGATQPANNVTLNLTINQAPGQDPEELARIIMRQINESTGTFLVQ